MKIYNYNPFTKEYLKTTDAKLDPLETQKQGTNIYLIPAHATQVEPPSYLDDEIPVFNGTGWDIVEDNRGITIYDKLTREPQILNELGKIPSTHTTYPPNNEHEIFNEESDCWELDLNIYKQYVVDVTLSSIFKTKQEDKHEITLTSGKVFNLNCTDNTCFNIDRAMLRAEKTNSTLFYSEILTLDEINEVYTKVDALLLPLLQEKITNIENINNATDKASIDNIVGNLSA